MSEADVSIDQFERMRAIRADAGAVYPAVNALSFEEDAYRPDEGSNSTSWLVWHLTRVQDQTVSSLIRKEPVWTASGWIDRFALALDPADTGGGDDPMTVGKGTSAEGPLLDYFEDVRLRTVGWLRPLDDGALSKVLDDTSEPPVTVESKLGGVIADDLQHVGRAAYVRGLAQRR